MDFTTTQLVIILLVLVIVSLVTGILVNFRSKRKYYADAFSAGYEKRQNEHSEIVREDVEKIKQSTDFKVLLENENNKGKIDGRKETLQQFRISYQPFVDNHDSFLKHTAEAGYYMQIFYEGLPIGDPMKRITKHDEKFKEENLKYLVDSATEAVNQIAKAATGTGIPVSIAETTYKKLK